MKTQTLLKKTNISFPKVVQTTQFEYFDGLLPCEDNLQAKKKMSENKRKAACFYFLRR
jgi:hypothetical protein